MTGFKLHKNDLVLPGRFVSILGCLFFVLAACYCIFYLTHGHDWLSAWFVGMQPCFVGRAGWDQFFNTGVKAAGNLFCTIGILVSIVGFAWSIFSVRNQPPRQKRLLNPLSRADWENMGLVSICLLIGFIAWQNGIRNAMPANDEIYSADNFASLHPFQTIAYYKLPNNHLFFNLLNNLVFHSFRDKVVMGRLISLGAYLTLIAVLFYGILAIVQSRATALAVTLLASLQFFTWGFSFQARGYELYALASWGICLSALALVSRPPKNPRWLLSINLLCTIVGYFLIPSFLFLHLALLVTVAVILWRERTRIPGFWMYQFFAFGVVFLCYLPALCFSGVDALAHNRYVAPMPPFHSVADFYNFAYPYFSYFVTHIFQEVSVFGYPIDKLLFLLPLLLLLARKDKRFFNFGLFYAIMWLVFFVLLFITRKPPFERNLIAHFGISVAALTLCAFYFLKLLYQKFQIPQNVVRIIYPAMIFTGVGYFIFHFTQKNKIYMYETLYGCRVNEIYNSFTDALKDLPPGSSVGFTESSFMGFYVCRKNGLPVSKCLTGNETYLVKNVDDTLSVVLGKPVSDTAYRVVKTFGDYQLLKK